MILHTERLEDKYGGAEIARTLSVNGESCCVYELIADAGYDKSNGIPQCVVFDDGDHYHITLDPYNVTKSRRKIKLDACEASDLRKILTYIHERGEENT